MRRSRPFHRGGIVVAGAAVLFFLGAAGVSWAGVAGSRHDFTGAPGDGQDVPVLNNGGVCTPCHTPHFSPVLPAGWARSVSDEALFYEQDGSVGANYIPGMTLLCYDCHDDMVTVPDRSPPQAIWSRAPQDIALNGAGVGYYENACGQLPVGANPAPTDGSPTGGHYWKTEPGLSPDYDRGDKIACSLCHDPHDTATGTNEAFFRTATWDGSTLKSLNDFNNYGTDLKASTYNASTLPNGSRNGTGNGRDMCAICHGYSDQGIQALLYNVTVPKPPAGVIEHVFDNNSLATACVACHGHNQVAGCNGCHGYPPMLTEAEGGGTFNPNDTGNPNRKYVENYPGGAGAHRRHKDALAVIGSTIFDCALCHGPNPGRPGTAWHNQGSGSTCGTVTQANVDIMGLTSYWGAGSGYAGTSSGAVAPVPTGYAFTAKGGPDAPALSGRCTNLTCHGNPPASTGGVYLNWADKLVDDTSGNVVGDGISICKWCHDATPARIGTGPWAPNVLGADNGATGVWTTGTWGADVGGHGKPAGAYDDNALNDGLGKAAADKDCSVCHDTRYTTNALPAANTPVRTHFDNLYETPSSQKRLRDAINGLPVDQSTPAAAADAVCGTCHQNGAAGAAEGTEVSTHSNDFDGAQEGARGSMIRSCRQCHDVHGANWNGVGRNLRMVGKWLDSTTVGTRGTAEAGEEARVDSVAAGAAADITSADAKVVFTANSGPGSYDDGFGGPTEPAPLHESVCVVCHADLVGNHNEAGSPEVLNQIGSHNPVGTDCMTCHDHDYDNAVATSDGFTPSGCNGCHGSSTNGQYWPDGLDNNGTSRVVYADDNVGAHENHVEAISRRVFGLTVADLLLDPGTATKQRQICRHCHPDPGGGGHYANSGDSRADVFNASGAGNYFGRFTVGAEPLPPAAPVEDITGTAYVYGAATEGTCNNLVCHNQAATPFWNTPPTWTPANTACTNIACHATTTYTLAHDTHVNGSPKSYACTECHANNYAVNAVTNPIPLAHGNGEVDMKWDNVVVPAALEAAHGGNGFYNKDNTAAPTAPSAGDTAFAYKSGGAVSTDPTYARTCYLVYCHGGDNDANVAASIPDWGGSATSPSPAWNSTAVPLACATCHADQLTPATSSARHNAHVTNDAWVPDDCGSCHVAPTQVAPPAPPDNELMRAYATHVDGSVSMAASVTYTAPDCTNDCHLVGVAVPPVSSNPGDWLDANPLACTDCHAATYIGTAPASGLHAATTAMAHDAQFLASAAEALPGTATCTHCHLSTAPSTTHLNGSAGVTPPTQNSFETTYNFNTTYIPDIPAGSAYVITNAALAPTSCQATCHSDQQVADTNPPALPASRWRRTWIGVADARPLATNNPGDAVCKNCHGDFAGGWNLVEADASTTDHTDPYTPNTGDRMSQHSVCQTCHGWGNVNYSATWADTALPSHGDGSITMNGPQPTTGAGYINTGVNAGGCAKACHLPTLVMNTNSGWPVNYGDFGSGDCVSCHNGEQTTYPLAPNVMGDGTNPIGTGATPQPYNDGAFGYTVNGHGADGSADNNPAGLNPGRACTDCHSLLGHHLDGVLDGVAGRGNPTRHVNNYHLVTDGAYPFIPTSATNAWDAQVAFDEACARRCHTPPGLPGNVNLMSHVGNNPLVFDPVKNVNTTPNAVRFGDKGSVPDGESIPYPVDSDITTHASTAADDFVACATCHNVHGTAVVEPTKSTNRMARDNFFESSELCLVCHK